MPRRTRGIQRGEIIGQRVGVRARIRGIAQLWWRDLPGPEMNALQGRGFGRLGRPQAPADAALAQCQGARTVGTELVPHVLPIAAQAVELFEIFTHGTPAERRDATMQHEMILRLARCLAPGLRGEGRRRVLEALRFSGRRAARHPYR